MSLILVRHGQSVWNEKNLFTGWQDVGLTEKGIQEAISAGQKIRESQYELDCAFSSVLKRANQTLVHVLEETDSLWIPVQKSWRLNERHYGGLTGLDKAETAEKHGADQVHIWRRSYDVAPPEMSEEAHEELANSRQYQDVPDALIPYAESLKTTQDRCLPYFYDEIAPKVIEGKTVVVVAHGNSLRAISKEIEKISDDDIPSLEIQTGIPIVYELDEKLNVLDKKIL